MFLEYDVLKMCVCDIVLKGSRIAVHGCLHGTKLSNLYTMQVSKIEGEVEMECQKSIVIVATNYKAIG